MTAGGGPAASRPFAGVEVLVIEDETIIAFLLEDMLSELGCAPVRHVDELDRALAEIAARPPHAAVLDVNLRGAPAYPIAERLAEAGIPFVFATGYGRDGLAPGWEDRPVLQKPFQLRTLAAALEAALRPAR